ncbi:MAG: hypothetical protein HC806_08085 [Anaerolineae bacterium]|nr:hypothetical protein [Anaerolineae bacterium]
MSGKTDVEVFFFADVKTGRINRFLQFQFETFKPQAEDTFKYELQDSVELGALNFGYNYWCFDLAEAGQERPDSDIAVVQHRLEAMNVHTIGNYVGLRFVYLTQDKRSELLIIYGESTDNRGIDCNNEELSEPLLHQMHKQVLSDFTVQL